MLRLASPATRHVPQVLLAGLLAAGFLIGTGATASGASPTVTRFGPGQAGQAVTTPSVDLGPSTSPLSNPPKSIPPTAEFARACFGQTKPTTGCNTQAMANVNAARAKEGLGDLVLPANYASLNLDQQMVAVTNAERTSRGLVALTERPAYDHLAKQGADADTDPPGPSGEGYGSIWVEVADPLAGDFLWMYDDGPNSPNGDCPQAGDPGCWIHRDIILSTYWATMGAGHDGASLAELFVQ